MPTDIPPKVPSEEKREEEPKFKFCASSMESIQDLMQQLIDCDAEAVVDVLYRIGEDWFVELVFKNHKRLFIGGEIPIHYRSRMDKSDIELLEKIPKKYRIFWSVFDKNE